MARGEAATGHGHGTREDVDPVVDHADDGLGVAHVDHGDRLSLAVAVQRERIGVEPDVARVEAAARQGVDQGAEVVLPPPG